jgi:hypothetical protein
VHVSSEYESLEDSELKTRTLQRHDGSILSAEEIFQQGGKVKLMASEEKEVSYIDGIKRKMSHSGSISNIKDHGTVIESACVEKMSKELLKHLTSKEKCGMNQITPYSSFAGEARKYQHNVSKYPDGVIRTSPQYYMTIGEYFGKNFVKRGSDIEHDAKDSDKNLTEKECVNNNLHQLVCENQFLVISTNLEESDRGTKSKNTPSKPVMLPAELKRKLVDMSGSQHGSKPLKSVKRRSSDPTDLLSERHKKRRFSYGGEEAAVFEKAIEIGPKMRLVANEKRTEKNEDEILEITERLEAVQAAACGLCIENATKTEPGGNETLKTTVDEKRPLGKESELWSETDLVADKGLSAENATETKREDSEVVKAGENEEMMKEDAVCWKPEQQPAAEVVSVEKATKIKPGGSEVVKTRNSEMKALVVGYAQCLKTEEQAVAEVVSIQKMTKMECEGSKVAKIRRNDNKIVKKGSPQYLKGEEQAVDQEESIQKTLKMKPGGSKMVKIRKNEVEMLVKENQHSSVVHVQVTTHGVVIKETSNKNAALKIKSDGNEMVAATKNYARVLRKERHHHVFENECRRNQTGTLQQKKNTVEDITNINPSHRLLLDSKFSKKKKEDIMFELFGENSDEPSRENSNHPDGVGFKVLQESNTCAVSAEVSDYVKVNAAFFTPLELNCKEKDNSSTDCQPSAFSYKNESEMKRFVKGTEGQSDHRKFKELGDNQLSPLSHNGEVKNPGSQKLMQLLDSVEQSNHPQGNVCSCVKDRESVHSVKRNNEAQSSLTCDKNDLHIAARGTVIVYSDTLEENGCQKDTEPEGCYETDLPVISPVKDGTVADAVAQNNGLKHDELQHVVVTHEGDTHLTGFIKERKNGDFYLVINMGKIDTLSPSPQQDSSGSTKKQISVNYNVAEGSNVASDGHSTNMKEVPRAENCTENPNMSLDAGGRVEENVNVSASDSTEVSTLCRDASECAEKDIHLVSDEVCAKQTQPSNQHLSVERPSRSELALDLVLLSKESGQDSVSESQNVNLSATVRKQTEVEIAEIHAETVSSQTCDERSKETEVKKGKESDRVIAHGKDIQKECDAGGKEKCVSESDCVLNVNCNKESGNFPQSTLNSVQSQSPVLQTDVSNCGKYSTVNVCRPSVTSEGLAKEQLGHNLTTKPSRSESVLSDSRSTDDIPHVADAPVSQTFPRIRVRDPESLGITQPESSYFEAMDKKLSDLTQFTYVLMQDMIRINERYKAVSRLTGSLRDTETALVKAEWLSPHMTYKAVACLDLYKCIERSFPKEIEEFLIRRLNELNPSRTYTLEELERCLSCCWFICNQNSLVPYPQQHQQQPVAVSVAWNKNNEISSLSQAGGQISNSAARQQTSESVQNITSVTQIQYTPGGKEMVTYTSGSVTNAPPPYDMHTREAGTNFNTRHSQVGNICKPQFTIHNPVQIQNSSSQQCQTYSNSASACAVDRLVQLARGQVHNKPSENRTVPKILQCTHGAQNTAQSPSQNPTVHHGNSNVVGYSGHVPVSGSSYSQHPPSLQGAPSYNSSSTIYPQIQTVQQGILLHHSRNDNFQNTNSSGLTYALNQGTQQDKFRHVMNRAAVLNKSAPNTYSQPYHRIEPIQQGTFSQSVSNVLPSISAPVSSSHSYPGNERMQQGTYSQPVNITVQNMPTSDSSSQLHPSAVQQSTFSTYLNNVAFPNTAHSSSHQYLPNKSVHKGMFCHHMGNNIPPQKNILLHQLLSRPTTGPGHTCRARSNLYPAPHSAMSLSHPQLTRMTLRVQQRVVAQESSASPGQENTVSYSRGSFPQQSNVLAVGSGSELQLHGTPQSVIQRQSSGKINANNSASNNLSYGGNSQNVPARNGNNLCEIRNDKRGFLTNLVVENGLSDKGNNLKRSNLSSILAGSTSDSVSDKRNNQSQFLSNSTSNSLPSRGNNQSGSFTNVTASNNLSDRRNNQSSYLTNTTNATKYHHFFGRGNGQSGFLTNSAASKILSGRNNQSDRLANCMESNSLPDMGKNQGGPPSLIEIPTLVPFQARLNGVNKQLNKLTENLPVSEIVTQNMNNVTHTTCTFTESVNTRNVLNSVCKVSEATRLGDSLSEVNSDITASSGSLQNSQTSLHGDKQSDLYGNQQRQLSNKVTTNQPKVLNSTLVAVQASESQNHAYGFLRESAGMLSTGSHSVQFSVYQTSDTHHRTDSGSVSELPEKTVSDLHSTENTLNTETRQNASDKATLQMCSMRQYSKYKPGNQPDRTEVVGFRNDMQLDIESEGFLTEVGNSEDIQVVADVGGNQNNCKISKRMIEKHSACYSYSPDPKTEPPDRAEGSGNTVPEVACKQAEQCEATILTVVECVSVPTSESSRTSSLNEISTDIAKEARGCEKRESDPDVKVVSFVLLTF